MGVEEDGLETTLISEDLVESIKGTCVGSIARVVRLDDEASADEIERREDEGGEDVGSDGETERGLVEGWDGGEEEGEQRVVDSRLHCRRQHFSQSGRCEACTRVRVGRRRAGLSDLSTAQASPPSGIDLCA